MSLFNIKMVVKREDNYIDVEDSTKAENKFDAVMDIVKRYNKGETEVIRIVSVRKLPNR